MTKIKLLTITISEKEKTHFTSVHLLYEIDVYSSFILECDRDSVRRNKTTQPLSQVGNKTLFNNLNPSDKRFVLENE